MKTKTCQEVRDYFTMQGLTIRKWAKENNFHEKTVYEVIAGRRRGVRGQAHLVAIALGIKGENK